MELGIIGTDIRVEHEWLNIKLEQLDAGLIELKTIIDRISNIITVLHD